MNRTTLLLSHGAVFAVGIAAAMIAHRGDESENAARAAEESRTRAGASTAGMAGGPADAARGGRGARDGAGPSGGAAVERLGDIVRMTDAFERQRALMELIDSLGPDEFAAVADGFREMDHLGNARDEYELLLRGWAKVDPLGALAYVDEHPGAGRVRGPILETWAGLDAAAAENWALANHDGDGPNPHLAAVIAGIAPHDVEHASRLVQTMPGSRERGQAIEAMTRALLAQGVDAALAFPALISDEHLRGSFVSQIADRVSRRDPEKAAEWVASFPEGEVQNRAARNVAGVLARQDVQQAAQWVKQLSPEAQAEAARGVIPRMSSEDIAGTARWVSTLAGTPNYDRVVEAFVWSCDQRAPEQSATWIQGVSDPGQQRRLYHRMLQSWARRDREAMQNWVASNNVPEDIRERFLR